MFEEAKGEWKDNEWQSKKEKWHGNEQRQAKHEKQHQKWKAKHEKWQSNVESWDWAATADAKANNATPINWDNPLFDLAYKMVDDGFDIGSVEDDLEDLHRSLRTDFHNNKEKIKTIMDDGIKEVGDVKQELRESNFIWEHANLKLIALAAEISDLKAEVTMLVARSKGSDEPAWKKARVE